MEWLNRKIIRESSSQPLRLRAVGDVNFGDPLIQKLHDEVNISPIPPLTATLGAPSLSFFNLECNPVSDPHKFHSNMISSACLLDWLQDEFTVANIANNHITDAGEEAFLDTLLQVENHGLLAIGGGKTLEEAQGLRTVTVQGMTIGFLACADFVSAPHGRGNHAGVRKPGVLIYKPQHIIKLIQSYQSCVDLLVCSLHTGLEFHHYPDPVLMRDAHHIIDAGAQILLIHHAHVRQGIEIYNKGVIAYGLGNFVFTQDAYMQQANMSTDVGLVLDILFDTQGIIGYEFWLSRILPDGRTILLSELEEHVNLYQEQLLFNQNLANSTMIRQEWKKVCHRYVKDRYYAVYWAFKRKQFRRLIHLLLDLRRRENRRWMLGILGL